MNMIDDFKIVVLDNVYNHWEDEFTRDMFNKIIELKKKCYNTYYGSNYAPVDKWDFHGTHLSLCEVKGSELNPIVSFRTITNKQCQSYGFDFNGYSFLNGTRSLRHKLSLLSFLNGIDEGRTLGSSSGLAFDPDIPLRDPRKRLTVDFFMPLYVYNFIAQNWDAGVIIGACDAKLNKTYANKLGFDYLKFNDETLPPIKLPCAGNKEFELMKIETFKKHALDLAIKYLDLWQTRMTNTSESNDLVNSYFESTNFIAA